MAAKPKPFAISRRRVTTTVTFVTLNGEEFRASEVDHAICLLQQSRGYGSTVVILPAGLGIALVRLGAAIKYDRNSYVHGKKLAAVTARFNASLGDSGY